tara:strand:+ start:661 stop:1443 length:783 start_codon:yes stop_codon:yes gene_type:complete
MAEAQTLTYDPNEQAEGELSTEEKESLEVGERLAEQQEQLLAGKFKDAEELEKGYIELQKKLGSSEKGTEEGTTETKDEKVEEKEDEKVDTAFLDKLWDDANKGELSKETLQELDGKSARDLAQLYLQYRQDNQPEVPPGLTEENVKDLKGIVGGEEEYTSMMTWAKDALQEKEVEMYDEVMEKGDPLSAFFAVQALTYRYNDAKGVDGQMLQGKAPVEKGDTFRSQAEVVRAMNDPRYDKDPAYRQDIYDKLERSNINF